MVLLDGVPIQLCLPAGLLAIGLQEGVLVAVQVVHQVPVTAVLGDDIDGPWGKRALVSSLLGPVCSPGQRFLSFGDITRLQDRGESCLSGTEHFWNLKFMFGKAGGA